MQLHSCYSAAQLPFSCAVAIHLRSCYSPAQLPFSCAVAIQLRSCHSTAFSYFVFFCFRIVSYKIRANNRFSRDFCLNFLKFVTKTGEISSNKIINSKKQIVLIFVYRSSHIDLCNEKLKNTLE